MSNGKGFKNSNCLIYGVHFKEIEEMSLKSFTNANELGNYIQNGKIQESNARDAIIFEKRKILIHNIVDFIAGMTDGYALEEYEKLR